MIKKILIIALLFTLSSCKKSSPDESKVGDTVFLYPLVIMYKDLGVFSWGDAINACTALGPGWRLPTEEELKGMFSNHDKIGPFVSSAYWTSSEYIVGTASTISFPNSIQSNQSKSIPNFVRAVKSY